jgi:hypothetical protein
MTYQMSQLAVLLRYLNVSWQSSETTIKKSPAVFHMCFWMWIVFNLLSWLYPWLFIAMRCPKNHTVILVDVTAWIGDPLSYLVYVSTLWIIAISFQLMAPSPTMLNSRWSSVSKLSIYYSADSLPLGISRESIHGFCTGQWTVHVT